jgi:hypothetical protein
VSGKDVEYGEGASGSARKQRERVGNKEIFHGCQNRDTTGEVTAAQHSQEYLVAFYAGPWRQERKDTNGDSHALQFQLLTSVGEFGRLGTGLTID